jgi:hypothetical protein
MDEQWTHLFETFDEHCGFTNALVHELDGDDLRICRIAGNVNSAITICECATDQQCFRSPLPQFFLFLLTRLGGPPADLNGPTMMIVALIVACTAAMIAFVAPLGQPWQYTCYSGTNIGAIFVSVCIGLYLYMQYKEFMQMMCDAGDETACPGYTPPPPPPPPPPSAYYPPPPPPSDDSGPDIGDALWRMANDKDGAQVLWVCFTHTFISIFRPVASFMLCCCKTPPVMNVSMEPQQMQMQQMQPQVPMQPMQQPMQQQQQPVYQPPVIAEPTSAQPKPTSLPELLEIANLTNYSSAFKDLGAADVADLQDITDEDLAAMGMKPLEINRLRRRSGM